jgi:hypothetical protein
MDAYPQVPGRVLYIVACAAPPVYNIGELVELAQHVGWTVCVILTPQAASWLDTGHLAAQTGYLVRSQYKRPDEPDVLPRADAIAVVPATFNTINKWAAGISDTFALGILNEALGLGLPIVAVPYAKLSLTSLRMALSPAVWRSSRKAAWWRQLRRRSGRRQMANRSAGP